MEQGWVAGRAKYSRVGLLVEQSGAGLGCWKCKVQQGWVTGRAKYSRVGFLERKSTLGLGYW